jgi:hypothetical protein
MTRPGALWPGPVLTPVTNHPRSLALLVVCPAEHVVWAYAAADAAVGLGRPVAAVVDHLLDYLDRHPMPTEEGAWAALVSTL